MSPVIQQGAYDIQFRDTAGVDHGFMLYRSGSKGAHITGEYEAQDLDEQTRRRALIFDDLSGGGFHSRRTDEPNVYAWAEGAYCRSPRLVLPAGYVTRYTLPAGFAFDQPVTGSAELNLGTAFVSNPQLVFVGGRYALTILANGGGSALAAKDFGAGFVAANIVTFNGDAYVGDDSLVAKMWQLSGTTGAWTQSADVVRGVLGVVFWQVPQVERVGSWKLVGKSNVSHLRYCSTGPLTDANWTPADPGTSVGNTAFPLYSFAASPRHLWALKPNGIHDINGLLETPNRTPYWQTEYDFTDSGKVGWVHNGYVYGAHARGLDRITATDSSRQQVAEWCHPGAATGFEGPINGRITAQADHQGGVYVSVWNGTNSYVCWGVERDVVGIPGKGPLLWHGAEWVSPTNERITYMTVQTPNGYNPRLWMATWDGTTARLYWMSLPNAQTPLAELLYGNGLHKFQESVKVYLPAHDWGDSGARKTLLRYEVAADRLGAVNSVQVLAAADSAAEASYTSQGTANTSPRQSFRPEANTTGYNLNLQLRLNGTQSDPVVLRHVKARAGLNIEQYVVRTYPILVGDNILLRDGSMDSRSMADVWQELEALQLDTTPTLYDEVGTERVVMIERGLTFDTIEDGLGGYFRVARLTVTFIRSTRRWGDGGIWGDGGLWGG